MSDIYTDLDDNVDVLNYYNEIEYTELDTKTGEEVPAEKIKYIQGAILGPRSYEKLKSWKKMIEDVRALTPHCGDHIFNIKHSKVAGHFTGRPYIPNYTTTGKGVLQPMTKEKKAEIQRKEGLITCVDLHSSISTCLGHYNGTRPLDNIRDLEKDLKKEIALEIENAPESKFKLTEKNKPSFKRSNMLCHFSPNYSVLKHAVEEDTTSDLYKTELINKYTFDSIKNLFKKKIGDASVINVEIFIFEGISLLFAVENLRSKGYSVFTSFDSIETNCPNRDEVLEAWLYGIHRSKEYVERAKAENLFVITDGVHNLDEYNELTQGNKKDELLLFSYYCYSSIRERYRDFNKYMKFEESTIPVVRVLTNKFKDIIDDCMCDITESDVRTYMRETEIIGKTDRASEDLIKLLDDVDLTPKKTRKKKKQEEDNEEEDEIEEDTDDVVKKYEVLLIKAAGRYYAREKTLALNGKNYKRADFFNEAEESLTDSAILPFQEVTSLEECLEGSDEQFSGKLLPTTFPLVHKYGRYKREGFYEKEIILINAETGHGKSSFALNLMLDDLKLNPDEEMVYVSLDDSSRYDVIENIICSLYDIDSNEEYKLRKDELIRDAYENRLPNFPKIIAYAPGQAYTIDYILKRLSQFVKKYPSIKRIIYDYDGAMKNPLRLGDKGSPDIYNYEKIKNFTQTHNLLSICISQRTSNIQGNTIIRGRQEKQHYQYVIIDVKKHKELDCTSITLSKGRQTSLANVIFATNISRKTHKQVCHYEYSDVYSLSSFKKGVPSLEQIKEIIDKDFLGIEPITETEGSKKKETSQVIKAVRALQLKEPPQEIKDKIQEAVYIFKAKEEQGEKVDKPVPVSEDKGKMVIEDKIDEVIPKGEMTKGEIVNGKGKPLPSVEKTLAIKDKLGEDSKLIDELLSVGTTAKKGDVLFKYIEGTHKLSREDLLYTKDFIKALNVKMYRLNKSSIPMPDDITSYLSAIIKPSVEVSQPQPMAENKPLDPVDEINLSKPEPSPEKIIIDNVVLPTQPVIAKPEPQDPWLDETEVPAQNHVDPIKTDNITAHVEDAEVSEPDLKTDDYLVPYDNYDQYYKDFSERVSKIKTCEELDKVVSVNKDNIDRLKNECLDKAELQPLRETLNKMRANCNARGCVC
jgi:hypothetical protein